jgi:hypothetical protein
MKMKMKMKTRKHENTKKKKPPIAPLDCTILVDSEWVVRLRLKALEDV